MSLNTLKKKPKRYYILLFLAVLSVVFLILALVITASSGNAGEVSSVLRGMGIIVSFSVTFISALIWVLIYTGIHRSTLNFILAIIMSALLAFFILKLIHQKQNKDRITEFTRKESSIAQKYIKKLEGGTVDLNAAIELRTMFENEVHTFRSGFNFQKPAKEFFWFHNIYIWVFIDTNYNPTGVVDTPMPNACIQFQKIFGRKLVTPKQQKTFATVCFD